MPTIDLPGGAINYRVAGPAESTAPPVLFVHGFLVDGTLWSRVAELLAVRGIRSYAPDWPLGAHRTPMRPDADQSPRGVAGQILAFIEALDLKDVTLVGNDTGGALCQFAIDMKPERIGRAVLTNCDAFDTFPPFPFNLIFQLLKGEWRMRASLLTMRIRGLRHSPIGFGLLARDLDAVQTRSWIEPALKHKRIRDDAVRFCRAIDPRELLQVSSRLKSYPGAARIVWGMADRSFTPALGRRLKQAFRRAEMIELPTARTFVSLDEPEALACQIAVFSNQ